MKPIFALFLFAAAALQATPLKAQESVEASLTAVEIVRIERALERRFSCVGCHRIDGTGGLIGPVLDGLGERADFAYTVDVLRDPARTIPGTLMPHQPMPERESRRLAVYLLGLPERPPPTGTAEAPPVLEPGAEVDGAALYARHCAACHGETGSGNGWNASNLPVTPTAHADPTLMSERPDDTLYDGIAVGGFVLDKSNRMPAFGAMLSSTQIRALVGHIRELCDCSQPAWAGSGEAR
ncbi:MAG: c-type cytochrome [Gemmatimonadetes bacterium]|nr:c-type cytochrome [Gemmatimonadota bacterium]NNL30556.1 c-type cytochrome [Gemmatimonadota bacterium]